MCAVLTAQVCAPSHRVPASHNINVTHILRGVPYTHMRLRGLTFKVSPCRLLNKTAEYVHTTTYVSSNMCRLEHACPAYDNIRVLRILQHTCLQTCVCVCVCVCVSRCRRPHSSRPARRSQRSCMQ